MQADGRLGKLTDFNWDGVPRLGRSSVTLPPPAWVRLRITPCQSAAGRGGTKIIEADPRGDFAAVFGLGERPRRIAEGVCRAVAVGFALT